MQWEELSSPDVAALDRERTVVMLPLGSVEQHGNHPHSAPTPCSPMPFPWRRRREPATPSCCRRPGSASRRTTCDFPAALPCRAETLIAVAEDVVASLVQHGFRRILIVNGHGGNAGIIDVLASTLGHRHYGPPGSPRSPISTGT